MFCFVDAGSMKHINYEIFVLDISFGAHEIYELEVLGISLGAFQMDVEHKLLNIGSLAIVSLGVLYKYILALVLSKSSRISLSVTPSLSVDLGI